MLLWPRMAFQGSLAADVLVGEEPGNDKLITLFGTSVNPGRRANSAVMLCYSGLKKRYYEIQINAPGVPPHRRVVHVVTLNEESPIKRAVAEGLLQKEQAQQASIREVSVQECIRSWQEAKWKHSN